MSDGIHLKGTVFVMIKSELVARIHAQTLNLSQRDTEKIVNAILDEIASATARGDRVELRGFGAFAAKVRSAHLGPQPENWNGRSCVEEARTALQTRKRNARTSQPSIGKVPCELDTVTYA